MSTGASAERRPASLDVSLDPSDRVVGSLFSLDPETSNYGEWGFARYLTPRAWLSTWSWLSSNAAVLPHIGRVDVPTLVVHYSGDRSIFPSAARRIYEASPSRDKDLIVIRGADHYGLPMEGDEDTRAEALARIVTWLQERFPV